ncbi:hypothetical protein CC85DRAFT_171231 [Cutaneotrichosporon oleaginosum]|uniref:Uncharacterized protein n=1 Tax=Cutaneotrichosporon oleaginosum TaxID=879819 RepID=A0A0J1BAW5_9TREE|nr:uncharacterized protein CC85DRAFT_171231 [Cutaneotrichosporon oleaginosum]KLT45074.1 hypothetical protein CC85DRAFT_171231 [Cutaneotrichosporon oleaginosum]TXT09757.1 hypothetical protein COLE_03691 [Cutaneotrichosporon oleaginosum]
MPQSADLPYATLAQTTELTFRRYMIGRRTHCAFFFVQISLAAGLQARPWPGDDQVAADLLAGGTVIDMALIRLRRPAPRHRDSEPCAPLALYHGDLVPARLEGESVESSRDQCLRSEARGGAPRIAHAANICMGCDVVRGCVSPAGLVGPRESAYVIRHGIMETGGSA